jgi:nitrogen fixation protein FixH
LRTAPKPEFALNGRHILLMFVAFFGVVIAVNVTMARFAVHNWTGLVVKNSYVASQEFNAKIAAHDAIAEKGWRETITADGATLNWALRDKDGKPVPVDQLTVSFTRPIGDRNDATVVAAIRPNGTAEPVRFPGTGRWVVTVRATLPGMGPLESIHRFEIGT